MNKKALTETDIRTKFITPAIVGVDGTKWNVMTQVREEVFFTKGRVIVRGKTVKRGEAKKADYLLDYKPNLCLAVVEAKGAATRRCRPRSRRAARWARRHRPPHRRACGPGCRAP